MSNNNQRPLTVTFISTWLCVICKCVFACLFRNYEDGHDNGPNEGNYHTNSKSRRDVHGYPAKVALDSRESRGRGRPSIVRRAPLIGQPREPRFNHWRSQNQDSFHSYPPKREPHYTERRPSPARTSRAPHIHHQSSSRSPAHGSQSHRGPPFHGHPSDHRSPSPRHFRSHPFDRRPCSGPPYRGAFRGHKRQPDFLHHEQRREPRETYNPRDRPHEHPSHGMKRWNEPGSFSHSRNGEHGPSGSQRSPREMHGRGSMPQRYRSDATIPAG